MNRPLFRASAGLPCERPAAIFDHGPIHQLHLEQGGYLHRIPGPAAPVVCPSASRCLAMAHKLLPCSRRAFTVGMMSAYASRAFARFTVAAAAVAFLCPFWRASSRPSQWPGLAEPSSAPRCFLRCQGVFRSFADLPALVLRQDCQDLQGKTVDGGIVSRDNFDATFKQRTKECRVSGKPIQLGHEQRSFAPLGMSKGTGQFGPVAIWLRSPLRRNPQPIPRRRWRRGGEPPPFALPNLIRCCLVVWCSPGDGSRICWPWFSLPRCFDRSFLTPSYYKYSLDGRQGVFERLWKESKMFFVPCGLAEV